ncbi:hypothetical protein M378DRAFT_188299 [Amanita muscaria Koide BX008]|uniref:DNA-directed RNA polymerase RBP11-like dimerisation domain-containing protein n=1 Tax=Amanita muscaria (strain Koide BX008) TaxID=946122 RepID=A0A0C2SVU7_AMAMK|nr:hypothetical protein M378DRAFT_188297 [Amanita muscaria Koide BX008]KIL58219.1 hypothetical protein M378DRAFT_188299 [Amanita muscaria Koide BX008]
MNAPPRYELFVLEDGERPVDITEDTKIPNAATIKVVKQDHTLANMLRAQLLSMPNVLFAGYKVPHPLQPYFLIKVQTDGKITPQAAVEQSCTKLIGLMSQLETKFKREFSFKDVEVGTGVGTTGVTASTLEDPYGVGTAPGTSGWNTGRDYLDF